MQIDRSGKWIGMRYPYELNVVGDAKATLQALIPLLARKPDRSWRDTVEKHVDKWWTTVAAHRDDRRRPGQPDAHLLANSPARMPADAIIAADSGSAANWYARHLKFTAGVRGSLSGTLATMGLACRT